MSHLPPDNSSDDEALSHGSLIRLDDFLKRSGLVGTGGEAKIRIQSGEVKVNGLVESRRRKQLFEGDVVELSGERLVVHAADL